jgi:hemin uptake protein HemP
MNPPSQPSSATPPLSGTHLPRIDTSELLRGAATLEIMHAGQRYLLRVTRENKLILTK